jgi:hypothetical protein
LVSYSLPLDIGGITFYEFQSIRTSHIWFLLNNLSFTWANHLKFICKVRDHKRKANIDFRLCHLFPCFHDFRLCHFSPCFHDFRLCHLFPCFHDFRLCHLFPCFHQLKVRTSLFYEHILHFFNIYLSANSIFLYGSKIQDGLGLIFIILWKNENIIFFQTRSLIEPKLYKHNDKMESFHIFCG